MPDFTVSPLSVVNQIKSNLQDRYDSGFPILGLFAGGGEILR